MNCTPLADVGSRSRSEMSSRLASGVVKQARVLLAVEEPEPRAALRVGLQLAGFLVADAPDGQTALRIMRTEPPDVLLLDLAIPVIGSIAILAELRSGYPYICVVTLASPDAIPTAIESVRLGASDFLEKPVALGDVEASIASVLEDSPPRDYLTSPRLGLIRASLRSGAFARIEPGLMLPGRNTQAGILNLAGIIQEAHGRIAKAQDFYARALASDERYDPAAQNLRRLAELRRFDSRVAPNRAGRALMIS